MYQSIEIYHPNGVKVLIEDIPKVEHTPENKGYALSVMACIQNLVHDINLIDNPSDSYSLREYVVESGFPTTRQTIF